MAKSTDLLAGHVCSASPLFTNMYDCAHMNKEVASEKGKIVNYDLVKGNGSLSNICSVIAPYMGKAGSSVYNKLTQGSRSDLLENALTAGDIVYEANKNITPAELGKAIGDQLLIEFKENGIKSGKGHASNGTNPRPASTKTAPVTDLGSLIKPPSPDTDLEYKALLDKVSEAQKKSNDLLADDNASDEDLGKAMRELKKAKNAVAEYAKTHADYTDLFARRDSDEQTLNNLKAEYDEVLDKRQRLGERLGRIHAAILDMEAKVNKENLYIRLKTTK